MKRKINKKRFWMLALGIVALIFLVVGIVKIMENDYLVAATSLITTLSFSLIALKISKGNISFEHANDGLNIFLPIGFAFTIVGGSGFMNAGVWGFGLTLVLVGLLFSPKKEEVEKAEE